MNSLSAEFIPSCYLYSFMKLADILLLSLAVVFIVIGSYEVMAVGLGEAYWSLMLAMILFFVYMMRKRK